MACYDGGSFGKDVSFDEIMALNARGWPSQPQEEKALTPMRRRVHSNHDHEILKQYNEKAKKNREEIMRLTLKRAAKKANKKAEGM